MSRNKYAMCLAICVIALTDSDLCYPAELTVAQILDKSKEAMQPPIQYKIRTNGIESLVSKQFSSDGSEATRTEETVGKLKLVTLISDKGTFEWYPKSNICIDTQLYKSVLESRAIEMKKLTAGDNCLPVTKLIGLETIYGKPLYIVEESPSAQLLAAYARINSLDLPAPRIKRMFIDSKSFQLMRIEEIAPRTKVTTSVIEYLDVKTGQKLEPKMFLPPDDCVIRKPLTTRGYLRFWSGAKNFTSDDPTVKLEKPEMIGAIEFEADTGIPIAPTVPGMTRQQFDLFILKGVEEIKAGPLPDDDGELPVVPAAEVQPLPAPIFPGVDNSLIAICTVLLIIGVVTYFALTTQKEVANH